MKKATKLMVAAFCAILTLCLTGCNKDPEDLIIGTWVETEITMTVTEGGQTQTESLLEEGMVAEMTMKEDNTYVAYNKYDNGDESTDTGTWSITDDKLTMTSSDDMFDFGPQVYTIEKLTKKDLVLTQKETFGNESMELRVVCKKK